MKLVGYDVTIFQGENDEHTYTDIIVDTEEKAIQKVKELNSGSETEVKIKRVERKEYDFNKRVTDVYGIEVMIDERYKKLHNYSNKNKEIVYNCPYIEPDKNTYDMDSLFFTDYKEEGIVKSIDDRLKAWDNPIKLFYAEDVEFNATKNDPDKKIWNAYVDYVKNHESEFFTKEGDWKQRIRASKRNIEVYIENNK